jgi:UDP-N-acetylmuramyl pentapeptide phosphotransferase/UDP-N-acetylglucosamine-1-phosphate transferase
MSALLLACVVTCLTTMMVLRSAGVAGQVLLDSDLQGPQKMHARPVPRVGGIGIACGLLAGGLLLIWHQPPVGREFLLLLVCALPAFVAGLVEDLTKQVRPAYRLAASALSALLGAWILGTVVSRTDIPGLDWIASIAAGAVALAVLVVVGTVNAINIIDGMNGLASLCVVIMLLGLGGVAFTVGDPFVLFAALVTVGATLGFFVWNYPRGLIFLGDGGAYLLGFVLAQLGVLLVVRHPQVSPMFPLLLCAYPIFETMFSMYRRKIVRGRAVGLPDGIHLHTLIYKRLMRRAGGNDDASLTRRNSMTSPCLWALCSLSVVPAVLWWDNSAVLSVWLLLFIALYLAVYRRIVRFRTPRLLVLWGRVRSAPKVLSNPGSRPGR